MRKVGTTGQASGDLLTFRKLANEKEQERIGERTEKRMIKDQVLQRSQFNSTNIENLLYARYAILGNKTEH